MILCELGQYQEALQLCLTIFAIWNHFLVKVKFRDDIEVVNPINVDGKFEAMKGPPNNAGIDGTVAFSDWLETFPQPIKKFNATFVKTSVSKRRNSSITTGYQWFNSSDLHSMTSFGIYLSETMGLSRADFLGHVWTHLCKLYVKLDSPNDAKEAMKQALSMNEISTTFNAHVK